MAPLNGTQARPRVIAHRGHSIGAPEQTMAAFELAAELGADMIEADVRRTRDGRLVMLHDATVDRTTDGHGSVSELSAAEVARLDAGRWFAADFAGERIPSLEELFGLARRTGIGLCLEAKGSSPNEHASIAVEVAREIEGRGRIGLDVLASFDHLSLAAAAATVPGLRCAPDRLPERGPSDGEAVAAQAKAVSATIVQHHHEDLTSVVVEELHRAGIEVWAWPPETVEEIERLLEIQVDGVMGDDVELILSAVRERTA
jgi:glycerophosphoryl diester phosphodiesterase